ncbi:hypothetical protein B0I35DRAFT_146641 [Stachybotrys elegans]|uniref:Uncharacterized protein n=1 Tax=Stachybotrys elegans TaxID=80388 RepID=A0A8K0SFK4_9HYPO|nr:hypothetical protein B0I35DRAFT_146641 [Stachybotrys elegans]
MSIKIETPRLALPSTLPRPPLVLLSALESTPTSQKVPYAVGHDHQAVRPNIPSLAHISTLTYAKWSEHDAVEDSDYGCFGYMQQVSRSQMAGLLTGIPTGHLDRSRRGRESQPLPSLAVPNDRNVSIYTYFISSKLFSARLCSHHGFPLTFFPSISRTLLRVTSCPLSSIRSPTPQHCLHCGDDCQHGMLIVAGKTKRILLFSPGAYANDQVYNPVSGPPLPRNSLFLNRSPSISISSQEP